MSRERDYIPSNAVQFMVFIKNLVDYVEDQVNVDPPIWTHVDGKRFEALVDKYQAFEKAHNLALTAATPGNITARRTAQDDVTHEMRGFVNQFLRFAPVTNADRVNMGIPNHDTIRTPTPVPSSVPEIEAITAVIRVIGIRMRNYGAASWAKPDHVHRMKLRWALLETRPGHVDELPNTTSATANPITLNFDEFERGKRIYYAGRWLNSKEENGPWSDIESAIIP